MTAASVGPAGELLDHVLRVLGAATSGRDVHTRTVTLVARLTAADVVAVCEDGRVLASVVPGGVGPGGGALPERGLARVLREGHGSFVVPGPGRVHADAVEVPGLPGVHLVTGRRTAVVDPDALLVVALVARCVGLVVAARHGGERPHRADPAGTRGAAARDRLRTALHRREQVLTASERFRRAVVAHRPLPELLVQIAESSAALLGGRPVSLVLADARPGTAPRTGTALRVAAAAGEPPLDAVRALRAADELAGTGVAVGGGGSPAAAAVHVDGHPVGALVVDTGTDGPLDAVSAAVLRAVAEHTGTALGHADAVRSTTAAAHDPLTGLPTRESLLHHLRVALRVGDTDGLGTAVVLVDLEGLVAGSGPSGPGTADPDADEVLRRVARRLRRCLRAGDVAARLGAERFAVLVRDRDPAEAAALVAARVREDVGAPIELGDGFVRIGTSVGVAVAGEGVDAAEVLRRADTAVFRAGAQARAGGPAVVFHTPGTADEDALRRQLESDLRRAVAEGEFELAYQPLVRLADGDVVGVEAVLRWRHPTRGLLDPGALLAGAHRSPAVDDLWRRVLGTACAQVSGWRRTVPDLTLTVGLPSRHVLSRTAADDVRRALADAALPPAALSLDVPASLLAQDRDLVATRLQDLRSTGARVLLGDFATRAAAGGVLSAHALAPLRRLPVDGFTLERTLVAELDGPDRAAAVAAVGTLCDLGAALDLTVVARGVERTEQVLRLQELGCPQAQGVLLGAARPAAALGAELLAPGPVPTTGPSLADLATPLEDPREALAVDLRPVESAPVKSRPRPGAGLGALTRRPVAATEHPATAPTAAPTASGASTPSGAPATSGAAVPVPLRVRPRDVRRLLEQSR